MKNINYFLKQGSKKRFKNGYWQYCSPGKIYSGHCFICSNFFFTKSIFATYCSRECFKPFYNFKMCGDKNPRWKGGITTHQGYRVFMQNGKRIKEHRRIMEKHLGRKLFQTEIVHHVNHNRLDNRIENLTIMSPSEHSKYHGIINNNVNS